MVRTTLAYRRPESGIAEAVGEGGIIAGGGVVVCCTGFASDPFTKTVALGRDCPTKWIGEGNVDGAVSADTDRVKGCVGAISSANATGLRLANA